jgi:hypothetical protein
MTLSVHHVAPVHYNNPPHTLFASGILMAGNL